MMVELKDFFNVKAEKVLLDTVADIEYTLSVEDLLP